MQPRKTTTPKMNTAKTTTAETTTAKTTSAAKNPRPRKNPRRSHINNNNNNGKKKRSEIRYTKKFWHQKNGKATSNQQKDIPKKQPQLTKRENKKNTYQKYIQALQKLENTCPTEGPEKEMKKNKLVAQCLIGGKC
jgi:hypothetical protein